MTPINFLERLSSSTLLADGAMGTMLHARGVGFDKCFDELNLTNPSAVAEIHRAYIEAGAQLIITNTFGANRFKLSKHGLQDDVIELNKAGVDLAKRVVSASFKLRDDSQSVLSVDSRTTHCRDHCPPPTGEILQCW